MNECVTVPKEALEQQRHQVLHRVERERKRKKRFVRTSTAMAAVLLLVVFSVRLSPTFASYVAKVPGFAPIVEMIAYNKGMADSMKNEYYEELGLMVTENQLTVTVVGVVMDYSSIVLSYEVDAPFDISKLETKQIELLQGGKPIKASYTYGWFSEEATQHIEALIEWTAHEPLEYDANDFEVIFYFEDAHETVVRVPFTVNHPIKEPKVYELEEEVVVSGQRFTIEKVSISPLRVVVDVAVEAHNSMQILSFDQLRLVDERGEDWTAIQNGFIGTGHIRDGRFKLHMQSNYFREPKKLTLVIGEVAALPKGQDYIEVDFAKEQIVYQPELMDWQLTVAGKHVTVTGDRWKGGGRTILFSAFDEAGNAYGQNGSSWSSSDESEQFESTVYYDEVPNVKMKIDIDYYPNIIAEEIAIPILP